MDATEAKALVERFYHELWNRWDLAVADEILAEDVRFRGSRGATLRGRAAVTTYVDETRAAFPDWHNQVDELVAAGDRVMARLTWTGTHEGPLGDLAPTGRRVRYEGAGLFRVAHGRIVDAWIVGDTYAFWKDLGQVP
jgi:steroid delta-isomerase-like uncharacterized protein